MFVRLLLGGAAVLALSSAALAQSPAQVGAAASSASAVNSPGASISVGSSVGVGVDSAKPYGQTSQGASSSTYSGAATTMPPVQRPAYGDPGNTHGSVGSNTSGSAQVMPGAGSQVGSGVGGMPGAAGSVGSGVGGVGAR